MDEWAVVAKLTKANNRKGGLSARSVEGLPFLLEPGLEVIFVPPQLRVPRTGTVAAVQPKSRGALVFFDTVTDQNTAEALAGCWCLARRADLPEGWDEDAWLDVTGWTVLTLPDAPGKDADATAPGSGAADFAEDASVSISNDPFEAAVPRGVVARVIENPAHPLLAVVPVEEGTEGAAPVDSPEGSSERSVERSDERSAARAAERLVPLVDDFIVAVDEERRLLLLTLPEGLL